MNELQQAQQNFDYAADDFIETSIYKLKAAELKVNGLLKGGFECVENASRS